MADGGGAGVVGGYNPKFVLLNEKIKKQKKWKTNHQLT